MISLLWSSANFMKCLPLVVLSSLLTVFPLMAVERKPNIVYILADDLGFGDVHCLNPQRGRIATPHLDQLAKDGMIFTDAHSGASVCTPTRYGLLTGRYAWRTRLQAGVLDGSDDPPLIAADRLTVASFLKQQGYNTAAIGKWHLGFGSQPTVDADVPDKNAAKLLKKQGGKKSSPGGLGLPVGTRIIEGPTARGFDYFWGCSNARTMSGLIENDKVIEKIEPLEMLPKLSRRAVDYVFQHAEAAKSGKPFFLYLALTSPHTPIVPSSEWQGKSGLGAYGDFVMQTDAVVGDVLTALEKSALADNTLVIFTSDNGCSPAADVSGLEKQGHFPSAGFRGYKADIWDGGHRVPFLVRWPGKVKAATQSAQVICHTDFMATCADLLDLPLPGTIPDSVSILPALMERDEKPLREAIVHHSIHGMFSIRQENWKLELCPGSGGWGKPGDGDAQALSLPPVQLYDMKSDPAETKNVQAGHPDIVAKLTALLEKYVNEGRSTPGSRQTNDVPINLVKTSNKKAKK